MKACIITDIEGVAGVVDFETQGYSDGKYHEQAKVLLTEEVNAAVAGLLEAGVAEVLVSDDHGPGGISFEHLHSEAKLMHGRPRAPRAVLDSVIGEYDFLIIVGQHAMAGVEDGNLNHTMMSRHVDYCSLNGKKIGEIGMVAYHYGSLGLPLIFVTGDEAACREAAELIPGITTTAVKKGLTRLNAVTVSKEKARSLIRQGAIDAVKNHKANPIKPLVCTGPYVFERRFFQSDFKDRYVNNPFMEIVDAQTVRFTSDNIRDVIYT